MSTLSRLFPISRLDLLRRAPFRAQALAICALFAIAGVAIVDDYGTSLDEKFERYSTQVTIDYALGVSEEPPVGHDRYYGVAFRLPALLLERAFGLQDSRDIYLARHLLTHLFFIAGGFACGMLAYRMLGSRWAALLAMLMFMLHPRLYAHSFFNIKDIPFAVMLVIALYLTHRAFRRDTIGAFLLCGIGVGLAINLRVFGLMLPPMILAMRALDLWQAGRGERKRILASAGAFAAAALATAYIIHPYYWENPLRFIEGIRVLSQHPTIVENLFMGEIYLSDAVPWNYIPVWFGITAPPLALPLGALGAAAVCWQGISRPLAALRDREARFRILLLGCFALPVAVAIALQSNIYNGWRQMYFLWGPFCLLAAFGILALASGGAAKEAAAGVAARLPGWVRGGGRWHMARRVLAYGVAGVGLITTLTAMVALHPYEYVYFNALTDTKTPGALDKRYDMDYWNVAQRQSLEYLLARYPNDALRAWPETAWRALILPQNGRDRFIDWDNPHTADFYLLSDTRASRILRRLTKNPQGRQPSFYIHPRINIMDIHKQPAIHTVRAYDSVIASIVSNYNDVDDYLAAYDDIVANGTLLSRSDFDIYAYDRALYYLSDNCATPTANSDFKMFLHFFPVDLADLPADSRERGFENRDFWFRNHAAFFDGMCVNGRSLPDYPIARIRTGQNVDGRTIWRADIDLASHAAGQALYESIAAGDYGQPVAQSDFDVYLNDGGLAYLKEPCAASDTDARFFLHIIPVNSADLHADRRESGFDNRDFRFAERGARIGDMCVAERELPGYAIERIRTGQFVIGGGRLWGAEFPAAR